MNILNSIVGATAFVLFVAKFLIHINLDRRNDYEVKLGVFSSVQYFLPYDKVVDTADIKRKDICNSIYKLAILFFVLSVLTLLILNFLYPSSIRKKYKKI